MRFFRIILLFSFVGSLGLPAYSATSELDEIAEMATRGQCAEAFEILAPLEIDMAGDAEFDLLFAYCALELEQTGLAMLALERVLASNPASETARFLLARAYFKLDALNGARREFELLLSLNPNPALRASIGQYLDAIGSNQPGAKNSVSGYLELGLGHDSNVTGGTANELIYFPGLDQNLQLVDSEVEDADGYSIAGAGVDTLYRVGANDYLYAGAGLTTRHHEEREDLDYLLALIRAGYTHGWRNQSLRFGLGAGYWRIDGDAYQDFDSLQLEWRNTLSSRNQIGVTGMSDRYRHRDAADEVLDYDDRRLRFSYSRLFGERANRLLSLSFDYGREQDINGRDDGERDYLAIRISGQINFSDDVSGFVLISSQSDDYERFNPLFEQTRSESQHQIAAGVIWTIRKQTSLRTTVVATDIDSNFSIYDSSGTDFSTVLRWDFR